MWRVSRLLLVTLFAVLAVTPATQSAAVAPLAGQVVASELAQVVQQPPPTEPINPTVGNAPEGPQLEPAQTEANAEKSRRKLVIAVIAAVLLGIVVLGRRARKKAKKA
jgi:hypothetical protein